ncbi:MAG: ethanolamine utilization protein EutH [Clostridiales bacterium]|nr:ethanolamine utilization protein EutH [Clostridiales bacterium]MDY3746826.1 ethanolamine utilization protein EutH [Lachnospiraceae bacterium]
MALIGKIVTYIIMACCVAGGLATIFKEDSGLAESFHNGIAVMCDMFIPICGLMAAVPYISLGVEKFFGWFASFGATPAVAAAIIMPPDCGSYAVALKTGAELSTHIIVIAVGFMCASTIAFNVPIGLGVLEKKDINYLALGTMSGFISIPFGVFTTGIIAVFAHPALRTTFTGDPSAAMEVSALTIGVLLANLLPIIVICILLALGLKFFPNGMMTGFKWFGKIFNSILTLIVVVTIVENYTGIFTSIFGAGWLFDPILGDEEVPFRAIELLGTIAMMLAGACPMVYLIQKFFGKGLAKVGKLIGLEEEGSTGIVACLPNGLVLLPLIKDMCAKDKVICLSFLVCAGYSLGDFLAFNTNFQPNLLVPIFVGQIVGGIFGIIFAKLIAVPKAVKLEAEMAKAE